VRARAHRKLARDLERLARREPGGAADSPIVIGSPAQVEVIAARTPCPLCGGALRLDEHAAATVDGVRLRVARVTCVMCRTPRPLYFRLGAPMLH
jgi:hypothetical protein